MSTPSETSSQDLANRSVAELEPAESREDNMDPTGLIEEHIVPLLDPDFLQYFVQSMSGNSSAQDFSIGAMRAHPDKFRPPIAVDTAGYERVADHEVPVEDGESIPVRVYHPDPAIHGEGPYPLHMNYHGGGFVLGDLITVAQLCLSMREAGVVVVDVNYRHCPEVKWGLGIRDSWEALLWARESASLLNINPQSVSIGGVSAGGHISCVLQHMARDAGVPLKLCMASVPATSGCLHYVYYTDSPFRSFRDFYRGPVLPFAAIKFFGQCATAKASLEELRSMWPAWWFAPLEATNWHGLCESFIRTAEVDPLRDEGEAYAMKLVETGNKVTVKRYLGSPHTFFYLPVMKQKGDFDTDSIIALREAHRLR